MGHVTKHRFATFLPLLIAGCALPWMWSCAGADEAPAAATENRPPEAHAGFKLLRTAPGGDGPATSGESRDLLVNPGSEEEAVQYYRDLEAKLVGFPRRPLAESRIADMMSYYGFPALLARDLEALAPAVLMDFQQLRVAVSNRQEFERAYASRPLRDQEILVARFFAPKIINVRDPQRNGVPEGGFGWRKVLRFRSREGSPARAAGLDSFYLLFNFADPSTTFPEGEPAGQIQALLTPTYSGGGHKDIYFLVYEPLTAAEPGKVGLYLVATFDLAGIVPDDKYYVPTSCGQCHGTESRDQRGGKVNYLDTDHWIDRTGDDFSRVRAQDVLVDPAPQAYDTIRMLNAEIALQNAAVIRGGSPFALLATQTWLRLHRPGQPDANRHVPAIRRGFAERSGDGVWTPGEQTDEELLPLLNQYCFRCHSSVRFHVFEKQAVVRRKGSIRARVAGGNMPQGHVLGDGPKAAILRLVDQLP